MTKKSVLLVEGKNDRYVLEHLFAHHQIPKTISIKEHEGVDKLLESLPVQIKGSEFQRIGVVLDANASLASRWEALRNIAFKAGYTSIPAQPEIAGTILVQQDRPKMGFWLMPNNTLPGMLEDFVQHLVPSDDVLWPLAEEALQKIPKHEQRFIDVHRMKAHIHTWLAWQEDPGTPMGLAITKRYLDANALPAQQFVAWIRRLFWEDAQ